MIAAKKWASLVTKVAESNFRALHSPYKLTYVVTKECHSKCLNCDIWKIKPQNELSLEEVERLAQNSPFLSWIDFTGGEPTDRKDFVEIVQSFSRHCKDLLLIHFPTNALKPEKIEAKARKIRESVTGKFVITVSIDGPNEKHDELRGIPGNFDRCMDTFKRLSKIPGVDVYAGMTLYNDNYHLIDDTYRAIKNRISSFTYNDLHINIGQASEHYYENTGNARISNTGVVEAIKDYKKKRGMPVTPFALIERIYQNHIAEYMATGQTPIPCKSLSSSAFLSEDGTVYPCSIWDDPIGNIRDHNYSLKEILNLEKVKRLKDQIKKKNCPNCWTPCEAYQSIAANFLSV